LSHSFRPFSSGYFRNGGLKNYFPRLTSNLVLWLGYTSGKTALGIKEGSRAKETSPSQACREHSWAQISTAYDTPYAHFCAVVTFHKKKKNTLKNNLIKINH
jgi:hypothetical protein